MDERKRIMMDAGAVYETERERNHHILRENGLLANLGDWIDGYIEAAPCVTHEEIRRLWSDQRPLSDDIIADRGER